MNETADSWQDSILPELRTFLSAAVADVEEELRHMPTFFDVLLLHGQLACLHDHVAKAIRSFSECARLKPDSYLANCALARIYMGQGRFGQSQRYFERAVALQSDDFKTQLGWLYVMTRQEIDTPTSRRVQQHIVRKLANVASSLNLDIDFDQDVWTLGQGKQWLSAYNDSALQTFQDHKAVALRGVIPEDVLRLVVRQHESTVSAGGLRLQAHLKRSSTVDQLSAAVFANFQLAALVQKMTGADVIPTYSFSIHYLEGGNHPAHRDRIQNELSMSISLKVEPEGFIWPLYSGYDGASSEHRLAPNDALLYRGAEVTHWRNAEAAVISGDQLICGFRSVHANHCYCI